MMMKTFPHGSVRVCHEIHFRNESPFYSIHSISATTWLIFTEKEAMKVTRLELRDASIWENNVRLLGHVFDHGTWEQAVVSWRGDAARHQFDR